jgi:DNA repair photolyase
MGLTKSRGNMYEFTDFTWNPIKGHCKFECPYCYVKSIDRFKKWDVPCYLNEKELTVNLGKDRTIFVGSMADMWGEWVKDEWIQRVLGRCTQFSNVYIFQSKNPERFFKFLPWLKTLRCYLGTTLETDQYPREFQTNAPSLNERVEAIGRLRAMNQKVFVTIEPIMQFNLKAFLEDIEFIEPDFVTIGADSKGHFLAEPTWWEVERLIENLMIIKVEIRQKKNLERLRK